MTTSHDIAADVINMLVASYQQPTMPMPQVLVKVQRKTATPVAKIKLAKQSVKAEATTARDARPAPVVVALPARGTLDGKGYLVGMRKAATRDERIALIASYVGYDVRQDFGSQEMSANLAAQREVRGAPTAKEYKRSVAPTVAGYVSGLPNEQEKRANDLAAREVIAAANLADHLYRSSHPMAATLADVEGERLSQIRRDLQAV